MARARTPRSTWIRAGLTALEEGGPDAVRIEALAKRLGVTKGGFYGYFTGREELLTEMLDAWEREAANAVIDEVEAGNGDAYERLQSLSRSVQERDGIIGLELAIREWARRDPSVAERIRRVDRARVGYLHALLLEATGDEQEAIASAAIASAVWMAGHLMRFDVAGHDHDAVRRLVFERTISPPARSAHS
ncbi:TetR/AcrR family transcriptional regulator [Agromyces sp. SYSU K20354]|uniref:TetR/AcrR family transcriptional regulator n=1 Tax=Agromyces cavernae TaxID=2898659 RepID=UPI001E39ECCF|nr:TetR/AcrR family transcriptional regulator [Agromyces cavernae]MCD2442021.1 TetR/AcrR family transcriptional regulator [Agromyces cavernae]